LAIDGGEWSALHQSYFIAEEGTTGTHLDRRLCGPQSWSGLGGKKKRVLSFPLVGIRSQLSSLVTIQS